MKIIIVGLTLSVCLLLASCSDSKADPKKETAATEKQVSTKDADPGVVISSQRPADIAGGAANASLTQAAQFAWNQFIALNWPAVTQDGTNREKPDTQAFGTTGRVVVWNTYRSRAELYPWQKYLPPGAKADGSGKVTFNYDALPAYNYKNKIQSCDPNAAATTPWINLDEISQISLNFMFDGYSPDQQYPASGNSVPTLIRFLAKGNRTYSDYITGKSYYNHGGNYFQDVTNFTNAVAADKPPANRDKIVEFPVDTVMVKSAWRLLTKTELGSGRFFTTPVRSYEKKDGKLCYNDEAVWGMVALHIVQKSPSSPYFTFATFEQADNIKDAQGQPVENAAGEILKLPPGGSPTTPGLAHTDYPNVTTTASGDFCQPANNPRLFYQNSESGLPQTDGHGGICVNYRRNPIPQQVIDVNKEAQQKIQAYDQANHVTDSPWPYYKLVNVQFQPFSAADINDKASNRLTSTYRQANIVVETNYTLQNFSGRQTDDGQTSDFTDTGTPFKNVMVANGDRTKFNRYNMGGCMGCHGNAEISGTDFSFMLREGPEIEPESPDFSNAARAALRKKYKF